MLGWRIIIRREREATASARNVDRPSPLATWLVGLGGLDWLDALVARGEAAKLSGNGYPTTYLVAARVVAAAIRNGPPSSDDASWVLGDDYIAPPGWLSDININHGALSACSATELLRVDAWDQS